MFEPDNQGSAIVPERIAFGNRIRVLTRFQGPSNPRMANIALPERSYTTS